MTKRIQETMKEDVKSCRTPWEGQLLLACRKCQKKLKKSGESSGLASVKKAVKALNKKDPGAVLHVLNVPCMKLCPKHAVAAYLPSHTAGRVFILRSAEDLRRL